MKTKPMRVRLAPQRRLESLIAKGLKIFSKKGFHAISAEEIAKKCGVSKSLLFHYFTDKSGFYVEVLAFASRELMALTEKSAHLSGEERLVQVISDYLDWVESHPDVYQMLFNSDMGAHQKVRHIHDEKREHYQTVTLNALFPGEVLPPKRQYDFIGASSYVEGMVLHWLKVRDLSRQEFQGNLLDGIGRIILAK